MIRHPDGSVQLNSRENEAHRNFDKLLDGGYSVDRGWTGKTLRPSYRGCTWRVYGENEAREALGA